MSSTCGRPCATSSGRRMPISGRRPSSRRTRPTAPSSTTVDLCLLIGIHESVGSAAPPSRRNGARDLFEAVRRIELVEREATHQPTGGSVYRNHLAVAEVVPVVEGQQITAIGHQRVRRADRVLKLDIRNKRGGTIRLTSVKLATCIRT